MYEDEKNEHDDMNEEAKEQPVEETTETETNDTVAENTSDEQNVMTNGILLGADRKKTGFGRPIAITAACAIVAGVLFAGATSLTSSIIADHRTVQTTQDLIVSKSDSTAVQTVSTESIVESCLPSVVSITNKGISEVATFFGTFQQESKSTGTGIIIGKNDKELLIVTNYHVVAGSEELSVVFTHDTADESADADKSYINTAQVKGYDANKDIAVIAVNLSDITNDTMDKIAIATIGDSTSVKMGSPVIAIGNALGYGQSTTSGIISALDREVTVRNANGVAVTNKYIQTDAAINSGNSGGALLNMAGEVIGINSAKIQATGVEGMCYAIPISDVQEFINNLMTMTTREEVDEADRGYLGIKGNDVTASVSQMYGIPVGVRVSSTVEGSPAEKVGLKEGDVIVSLDGITTSTMSELQGRLAYYKKGETVSVMIKRPNGAEYTDTELSVTLGSREVAGIDKD